MQILYLFVSEEGVESFLFFHSMPSVFCGDCEVTFEVVGVDSDPSEALHNWRFYYESRKITKINSHRPVNYEAIIFQDKSRFLDIVEELSEGRLGVFLLDKGSVGGFHEGFVCRFRIREGIQITEVSLNCTYIRDILKPKHNL